VPARPLELRRSARDRLAAAPRLAAAALELRGLVRARRPGAVIGWSMRGGMTAAAATRRLRPRPRIVFQHNDLLPGPAIGRLVRRAARRADSVVALSRAIADDLGVPAAVVHPGVDLERFSPSPPANPPVALVLGAVVPWKRPELALDAVAIAARELPDLRLVLAGAPLDGAGEELLASLRRRAELPDLAGRVTFAGRVPDQREALAAATCLLHCADREPFGLALVEALASGRPVAAPGACGPAEIVDAASGRLYAPGDPAAAARALVDVMRHAEELGRGARARAERDFDVRAARERWSAATSVA
jgi:glycosyltransferase involved in cell wall biosynthesis